MTEILLASRVASLDAKLDHLTEKVAEIREMIAEERGRHKGYLAAATVLGTVGGIFASLLRH